MLAVTRYADAQTTYLYTPDLNLEANPLASYFGLGWTGLIAAQIIGIALIMYALWGYCFKRVEVPLFERSISLKRFISLFHFRDTARFWSLFIKFPTNKHSLRAGIGYIVTYVLICISALVSTSTTMLLLSSRYREIYGTYQIPLFLYASVGIFTLFFTVRFYNQERLKQTVLHHLPVH